MPPRKRAAAAAAASDPKFENEVGYYKAAYRARIKAVRPTWNNVQITGTLAWMWMHLSADERQLSADQRLNDDQNLPATDDSTIPSNNELEPQPEPEPEPEPEPAADAELDLEPPLTKVKINTTAFAFWPDESALEDPLPDIEDDSDMDEWLRAGLSDPGREADGRRWYGTHFLGRGSTGRISLWLRVDDTKLVQERIAVRDVDNTDLRDWTNPIKWHLYLQSFRAISQSNDVFTPAMDTRFAEYDKMTGIGQWYDKDISDNPPEVIPELFIWSLFDQLVDAFSILGTGGDEVPGSFEWDEIRHKDVHLSNIFVKKREGATGERLESTRGDDWFVLYEAKHFPNIVLADFHVVL
ncbi:hypothetical protein CC86DRAFT_413787 [Ophiobolus disseminans]|uniref:Protein kinase domain-containing protein n=1 Tax=Ophiobolus disseminans TaxID=1469910 RepID=A0A6A6ZEQ6_9PLEO|nr:hypothetical protein CC86DRAFT_413787 [Ophiobolus disseminans]